MVTAATPNPKQQRPPLRSSNPDNPPPTRLHKTREVSSRYLSLSSSSSSSSTNTTASTESLKKCRSPLISNKIAGVGTPKSQIRSVSAGRRRLAAEVSTPSNVERILVKTVRSLSVSFQGESFSLPVSKVRDGAPDRRKVGVTPGRDRREGDFRENLRPSDQQQHLWPGRLRSQNSSFLNKSFDYGSEEVELSGSSVEQNELTKSIAHGNEVGAGLKLASNNLAASSKIDFLNSESENPLLSEGTRGSFNGRGPSKLIIGKKLQTDSPAPSPRGIMGTRGLSPLRSSVRTASPSRAMNFSSGALFRGLASPISSKIGIRNSVNRNDMGSTQSFLSFASDVRREKMGENRIADAHELRILHNRQLQWRFANAKVENALRIQKIVAEKKLYNTWRCTSELRDSVKAKRVELQLLRQNLKLYSILKEQEPHLEKLNPDHCDLVSDAIEALEASIIRLPVVSGARADVQEVRGAISSAVDLMEIVTPSLCSLQPKMEQMNLLASQLSSLSAKERALLEECEDFFSSTLVPLQVKHNSLETHILQIQHLQESIKKDFISS